MIVRYLMYLMFIGCVAGLVNAYRLHDEAGRIEINDGQALALAEQRLQNAELLVRGTAAFEQGLLEQGIVGSSGDMNDSAERSYVNAKRKYDEELAAYNENSPETKDALLSQRNISAGAGAGAGLIGLILLVQMLFSRK